MKEKRIIIFEENLGSLLQMPHTENKFLELECRKIALRTILKRDDEIGNVVQVHCHWT